MADPSGRLLDDFNRASLGANWTTGILTSDGLTINASTTLVWAGAGYRSGAYWNVVDFGPNVCVIVDVSTAPGTDNDGFGLYLRLVQLGTSTVDGYAVNIDLFSGVFTWTPQRLDNGAATQLGATVAQAVVAGDQIALMMVGSELTGWRKASGGSWSQVFTRTDATYAAAGKIGVEMLQNATTKINNLYVGPVSLPAYVSGRASRGLTMRGRR